jgi:hypothetical protein
MRAHPLPSAPQQLRTFNAAAGPKTDDIAVESAPGAGRATGMARQNGPLEGRRRREGPCPSRNPAMPAPPEWSARRCAGRMRLPSLGSGRWVSAISPPVRPRRVDSGCTAGTRGRERRGRRRISTGRCPSWTGLGIYEADFAPDGKDRVMTAARDRDIYARSTDQHETLMLEALTNSDAPQYPRTDPQGCKTQQSRG